MTPCGHLKILPDQKNRLYLHVERAAMKSTGSIFFFESICCVMCVRQGRAVAENISNGFLLASTHPNGANRPYSQPGFYKFRMPYGEAQFDDAFHAGAEEVRFFAV